MAEWSYFTDTSVQSIYLYRITPLDKFGLSYNFMFIKRVEKGLGIPAPTVICPSYPLISCLIDINGTTTHSSIRWHFRSVQLLYCPLRLPPLSRRPVQGLTSLHMPKWCSTLGLLKDLIKCFRSVVLHCSMQRMPVSLSSQSGDSVTANEPMLKSAVFYGSLRLEKQLVGVGPSIST